MDQRSAVAVTAFIDVWPRATGNGDRHRPMRHWRGEGALTCDSIDNKSSSSNRHSERASKLKSKRNSSYLH